MTGKPPTPSGPSDFAALLSGARLRLRGKSAFFATLLLHTDVQPSSEVALAATDGDRVYLNPEAAAGLSGPELDGLLLHEVLHAALSHVQRRGPREKKRWNRAADLIVNGMVAQAGLPLAEDAARDDHLETLSVEEVYAALEDSDEDGRDGQGQGEAGRPVTGHRGRHRPTPPGAGRGRWNRPAPPRACRARGPIRSGCTANWPGWPRPGSTGRASCGDFWRAPRSISAASTGVSWGAACTWRRSTTRACRP